MNAKIIEGLTAVRDGIDLILEGYKITETVTSEKAGSKRVEEVADTPAPVVEETTSNNVKGNFTREQLDGMTYNNIKKLAKEVGVSAVGSREDITARILGETTEEISDTNIPEEEANEAPVKTTKKTKVEKTEPEEVEVDEKDNDPLYTRVVESVAEMSNEEIADVLADIGVSAKGKREALIEKVVQAVRDGLLDFDDEDEKEVEETPAPTTKKTDEAPAPTEPDDEDDEDTVNDINNPDMTKARKKAILAQDDEIRNQFKSGGVDRNDFVEFLQSFYDTEDDMSDMSDDDLLDTYIDAVCRLINDEGDLIEEGAYTLNGEPACCGRVLTYSEDTNVFICEHCGEEYEAE